MRSFFSLTLVLCTAAVLLIAPAPASAASCDTEWGSLPESAESFTRAPLVDIRSGQYRCFDRLVFQVAAGRVRGFDVRYVKTVYSEGKGDALPLRGDADLKVTIFAAPVDRCGQVVYHPETPRNITDVSDYRTFRQVRWAGSFESYTTIGLGVRARLPFRVFRVAGPGEGYRMIVDVAHTW